MRALAPDDPRVIGEYRLRARLGAGGMGRVYLGLSPAGRAVAIKVVNPDLAGDAEFLHRFAQEVAAARAVSGIYTAPVVASGLHEHPPWLATAFVPGPSLDQVVGEHGPLPEAGVWPLLAGLSEALAAIHACGVVHRDLKPANVLLATDGPRVIDFGISRATDGTVLTAAGVVFGTPGYMSPEQAEGQLAGPASDMFALGCVIAYAAGGAGPFGTGTAAAVLYRVVHGEAILDRVPPALREIVSRCLAKDPAARPAPAALAAELAGRDRGTGPSAVAFWPRQVAGVLGAYQARLEQEAGSRGGPRRVLAGLRHASGDRGGVAGPSRAVRITGRAGYTDMRNFPQPQGYPGSRPYSPSHGYPSPQGYSRAGPSGYPARSAGELPAAAGGRASGAGSAAGQHAQRDRADVRGGRIHAGLCGRRGAGGQRRHGQASAGDSARAGSGHITLGGVAALAVVAALIEVAAWLGIARACRNGRGGARIIGTVLFGLHTIGLLGVLANPHPGLGLAKITTLLSWLIACAAVVFLWQRPSSAFFAAAAGRRS